MPEIHGSHARIYTNGMDISTLFRESEGGRERELVDTTAYASTASEHIISPMSSGMITASGMIDIDADTGAQVIKDTLEAAEASVNGTSICVLMARDTTIGDPGFALVGSVHNARDTYPHAEVASTKFDATANRSLRVKALHPKAARTAAHNSTGLDHGSSTAYGGLGILQVFALSGTTPVLTAKLQHSSDSTNGVDGTWVDLGTFASITTAAVTAGYADHEIVATGTVNRWLRINVAVTSGSLSSVTFAAQFGRYNSNK